VTAILAGQLSIGWSNDSIDAARDRATERRDKPVARGAVAPRTVGIAAALALVVCVVASLALGWAAGLASIVVAASGWAYNLGLKATAFSWLPYAVAFGMLPAVATLALPAPSWPAPWAMISGALFGVSAHLGNVLPDLTDDAATGVRGFPHRLGARASAVGCTVTLVAASMVILFGSGAELTAWRWVAAAVLGLVAVAGVIIGLRRPTSRALFTLVIAVAAADLVLFAASGASLT
jgi:4-hydroxybenzoate polyprenyltransferase